VRAKLPEFNGYNVELYANATNLFDKEPPIGSLYSPYYDVIGRYVTLGARMRF
jgi:outer membrane receptor protein involved in Fe transport